jgi:hypothetical protein
MRKFILIAAMVFVSATAQAGGTRTLITQASNDEPAATEQKAVEAPKYVDRPSAVDTTAEQPKADATKPVADKTTAAPKVEKPKRRRESTEARVIYELHRHGIYW